MLCKCGNFAVIGYVLAAVLAMFLVIAYQPALPWYYVATLVTGSASSAALLVVRFLSKPCKRRESGDQHNQRKGAVIDVEADTVASNSETEGDQPRKNVCMKS